MATKDAIGRNGNSCINEAVAKICYDSADAMLKEKARREAE